MRSVWAGDEGWDDAVSGLGQAELGLFSFLGSRIDGNNFGFGKRRCGCGSEVSDVAWRIHPSGWAGIEGCRI
ncbi:hypothetical protein M0R45_006106 [Rubus argutus]|uniref:Uncharacterized protein n=1 Tax=Rubus argutus TaxID=59490 RepID=A0AAW1YPM9_RUBAR